MVSPDFCPPISEIGMVSPDFSPPISPPISHMNLCFSGLIESVSWYGATESHSNCWYV